MNIRILSANRQAFTLAEVVVALAMGVLLAVGIIRGYTSMSRRTIWSVHSAAAQAMAAERLEQCFGTRWLPQYSIDDLVASNFTSYSRPLDSPTQQTNMIYGTNFTTITQISTNPPLKMVRVDCVWSFDNNTITNSAATIRGPNL